METASDSWCQEFSEEALISWAKPKSDLFKITAEKYAKAFP